MLEEMAFSPAPTQCVQALPHRTIYSLAAYKGQGPALRAALGVDLPATPRRMVAEGAHYFWSGPESWLVMPEHCSDFQAKAAGLGAVTDQSDGRFLARVSGPNARKILGKLVPIDLHQTVFPSDATAITLAAHIGVQLWREDENFVLACFRSFGEALHHALTQAAVEFEERG